MAAAAQRRTLEVLPSIDVRGGRVVDLFQGDYARETVYAETPEAVADRFLADGARWIHIVDLDGSKAGSPENREVVQRIVKAAQAGGVRTELGGGIRSLEAARAALDAGVTRVIFGTAAVEHPALVAEAVDAFGAEAVVVGIDARDGVVATRGWLQDSGIRAVDLARQVVDAGIRYVIYTDVNRDSTLTEPNFGELEEMVRAAPVGVIASGGISTAEQVRRLATMDLAGAIIGSALYAGKLTLKEALDAAG